ncbi:MAG TPA: hypothetical protein VFV50_12705 [Bdellovibrionales bacterium]|nr:hypothetical protein [Bdellovibrionales bacterium]
MKILIVLSALFIGQSAAANQWTAIINCNGGAMVVDEWVSSPYGNSPNYYQLVMRDINVIQFFISRGLARGQVNGKNELIVPVYNVNGRIGPYGEHQGSFMSSYDGDAHALAVAPPDASGGVRVSLFHFQYYGRALTEKANWYFNRCVTARR